MKFSIERIEYLMALLPLGLLLLVLYFKNQKALNWINLKIGNRFKANFTVYNFQTLKLQFLIFFAMSLLLGFALINFQVEQDSEVKVLEKGIVFFIVDASLSMLAGDTTKDFFSGLKSYDRLEEAQNFASDIVDLLPEHKYGVITVSGDYVVHSMPIVDPIEVKKIIRSLMAHNFENTGLILKPLFRELLRLSESLNETFQVVFISDGEQLPEQKEDLNSELEALQRQGIVVHTVGVGTKEGGKIVFSIVWYDSEKTDSSENKKDDRAGYQQKESKREQMFTHDTYRQDELLQKIAQLTNGKYLVYENGDKPKDLVKALKSFESKKFVRKVSQGKVSYSCYFVLFFLVLFTLNLLIFFPYKNVEIWKEIFSIFFWSKKSILVVIIFFVRCNESLTPEFYLAHKYNEEGRNFLKDSQFEEAKNSFRHALSYSFREHIVLLNLGNVYYSEGKFIEAHETYQKAIFVKPNFSESYYNDAIALFEAGNSELKPEVCDVERAISFWENSILRFQETLQKNPNEKLSQASAENLKALQKELLLLKEIQTEYCKRKNPTPQNTEQDQEKQDKAGGKDSQEKQDKAGGKDSQEQQDKAGGKQRSRFSRKVGQDHEKLDLSEEEKQEIQNAFNRMNEREEKSKVHKRTRHEQSNKERNEKELRELLEKALW